MCEKRALKRVRHKREEASGDWRKLHNAELCNIFFTNY
jgi:hypothetical protein